MHKYMSNQLSVCNTKCPTCTNKYANSAIIFSACRITHLNILYGIYDITMNIPLTWFSENVYSLRINSLPCRICFFYNRVRLNS